MRYREIDPLTRVAGILWAALSLVASGIGVWTIWNGAHDNARQLWIGLVFVVMGMLSAAFGLALAFEREPKRKWLSPLKTGVVPNAKTILFFLTFLAGGLALLGGMLVPQVLHGSPAAIVLAICFLAAGTSGLWVIVKKRRKQRARSLKAAGNVAKARERRRLTKRKRS
ncbi:hypothetical protein [Luteolibacter soli]|uniref:Transmembrane protein n=1 Tax=Luteolibacter soli TaxID=3135280 RepID=A0ABU9AZY4_9BACT